MTWAGERAARDTASFWADLHRRGESSGVGAHVSGDRILVAHVVKRRDYRGRHIRRAQPILALAFETVPALQRLALLRHDHA